MVGITVVLPYAPAVTPDDVRFKIGYNVFPVTITGEFTLLVTLITPKLARAYEAVASIFVLFKVLYK